jgi:hypothetical protein
MAPEQEYEDKVEEPVNGTTTLYRPVGQEELNLIKSSGYREFPPRLPHQPIFYPVLNEEYATQIARDWPVIVGQFGKLSHTRNIKPI